jgi:hypothetical protein
VIRRAGIPVAAVLVAAVSAAAIPAAVVLPLQKRQRRL